MRHVATLSIHDQVRLYLEGHELFASPPPPPETVARAIQFSRATAWRRSQWLRDRVRGIVK